MFSAPTCRPRRLETSRGTQPVAAGDKQISLRKPQKSQKTVDMWTTQSSVSAGMQLFANVLKKATDAVITFLLISTFFSPRVLLNTKWYKQLRSLVRSCSKLPVTH